MGTPRIYTRTGDDGTTGLVGGNRVPKDDLRIEAYGTVDELSSHLGVIRAEIGRADFTEPDSGRRLDELLGFLQHELFELGARLASDPEAEPAGLIDDSSVERLESWIDVYGDEIPPLRQFVLPGGGPCGSALHVARCVARRAERRVTGLTPGETSIDVRYLNRLSDLLFVLARWSAYATGAEETPWQRDAEPPAGMA